MYSQDSEIKESVKASLYRRKCCMTLTRPATLPSDPNYISDSESEVEFDNTKRYSPPFLV